jgi:hypothetical protein
MIDFEPFDIEAAKGKLWCGRSYKNLVEECPAECPGATDEECGEGMTCFNMATENVTCTEVGVGIKEPVDSANLWCGATWNEVLENCAKSCPEGSDEECGDGMMCYDLTGNDLICEYEGVGVKEKGDPDTRFCGVDYNDMLANCPKRCPGGTNDECGEGMICFEGSPCTTEGATNPVTTEEETTTEGGYCGSTFKDAMSCATPCSSSADCPGQTCHSNVACLWEDVSVNFTQTTTSSSVWNNFQEVTMQEPTAEAQAAESNPEPIPAPAPAPEEPAASEPAASEPAASEPAASEPVSEAETANSVINPFEDPTSSSSNPTPMTGLQANHIRMAIYGLNELGSHHLDAWESLTKDYFEGYYNDFSDSSSDATRAAVTDVATVYDVTMVSLSSARRGLRSHRRTASNVAFLLEYTQTTRYLSDSDIMIGEVMLYPFSNSVKRMEYINFLQESEPSLFGDLTSVSGVFLPQKFEASVDTTSAQSDAVSDIVNPKYSSFFCHNSGAACPSGQCPGDDACIFVPDSSNQVAVASYIPSESDSSTASDIVNSALSGGSSQGTGSFAVDSISHSNAAYGPTTVTGEMTLHGMMLNEVDHIYEWQYLTSVYEQNFYNMDAQTNDYVKNSVYNVATSIEMLEVTYDPSAPNTMIRFKQVIKYDTPDPTIPISAIVTQPFLTVTYRNEYIDFLKTMLPASFGSLDSAESIPDSETDTNVSEDETETLLSKLTDTFYCAESWPVDCLNAARCESGDNCPYGQKCFTAPSCIAEIASSQQQSGTESTWVDNDTAEGLQQTPSTFVNQYQNPATVVNAVQTTEANNVVEDSLASETITQSTLDVSFNQQYTSTVANSPITTESTLSLADVQGSLNEAQNEVSLTPSTPVTTVATTVDEGTTVQTTPSSGQIVEGAETMTASTKSGDLANAQTEGINTTPSTQNDGTGMNGAFNGFGYDVTAQQASDADVVTNSVQKEQQKEAENEPEPSWLAGYWETTDNSSSSMSLSFAFGLILAVPFWIAL